MSDTLQIPVTTFWDVVANALDDPWFWILSVSGMAVIAWILRSRLNRMGGWRWPSRR